MIIFTIILDPEQLKQIILDPAPQHCDTDVMNFLPLQTYSVFLMGLLILFFMVPVTTYQYSFIVQFFRNFYKYVVVFK
jgi:hypothetical protein